jgi:hypothetical protein
MWLWSFMVSEELKIKGVWERISPRLVEKSFKKCGTWNSLDGSEDDFFQYSDDYVSSADRDNSDDESSGE